MSRTECPTNASLKMLCDGALPAEQELELYAHVDDCVNCQHVLDTLTDSMQSGFHIPIADASDVSEILAKRLDELKAQGRPQKISGDRLYKDLSPWFDTEGGNEDAIGQIDEYELLECVGRGGMGIVFQAHDSKLTRNVALKVMSPSLLADASAPARFLREAQSAAQINHPNVVTLFAVSEVKELPYIAMEYVKGKSLQELLDQEGKLDVDTAVTIAKQITAGLAAAHDAGVIHRDIKPANVLIDSSSGRVKLTDFGLARSLDGTQFTASGFLVGTPEFVAPEQIDSGRPVDHRADLFSLGSLFYRLVSDRTPFASDSTLNTLARIGQTEPQDVRSVNKEVPNWLANLIHWLLSKAPEHRPQNAKAVSRVLEEQSVDALPPQANKPSSLPRIASRDPVVPTNVSKRVWSVALIGAIAFLCSFGWRAWWKERPIRIGTAEELVELCESNSETDIAIILTSNEPYFLEPILLEGQNLLLKKAEGIEPKLIFELDEMQTCIEVIHGDLKMSGIAVETQLSEDFDDEDQAFPDDEFGNDARVALINCEHGSLALNDCRIVSQDTACIRVEGTSCAFNNCDLIAVRDACLIIDAAIEDVLAITNCLLVGEDTIYLSHAADVTIVLVNNTLIGDVGCNLSEIEPEHRQIVFAAQRNVLDVSAVLFNVGDDSPNANDLIENGELRWEGETNLYSGPFLKTDENAATTTLSVLAEWRELTDSSELKSKVTKPDYEFDRSVLTDETIAKNLDRDDLTFDSDEGFGIQGDSLIP